MVKVLIGVGLAIVILAVGGFAFFALGLAPTATSDSPFPFEEKVANMALKARIQKADMQPSPVDPSEQTFLDGAKPIYREHWRSLCHGFPRHDSEMANGDVPQAHPVVPRHPSLYEPARQLLENQEWHSHDGHALIR